MSLDISDEYLEGSLNTDLSFALFQWNDLKGSLFSIGFVSNL